jgi:hypothetical protein
MNQPTKEEQAINSPCDIFNMPWPLEGLRRSKTTPPLHAVMLRSFRIPFEAIYFRNLGWIWDSGGRLDHRTCASTLSTATYGIRVVAPSWSTTLRSAMSVSSSTLMREHNSRVRSTRVSHQIQINRYNITNI